MPEIVDPLSAEQSPSKPVDLGTPDVTPGPKYDTPTLDEQAAHREAARAAVADAQPTAAEGQVAGGPRMRDAEGSNSEWGYNGGDRADHRADMAQARDRINQMNGIPTDTEKAQMRADMAKKGGIMSKIRGFFGR